MMAVDTSALMAILKREPEGPACQRALAFDSRPMISAATIAEATIVASRRGIAEDMSQLIDDAEFEIVAVTGETAKRIQRVHQRWGKGVHPAALNFGDCFAYDLAASFDCPLLYVGRDFSRTDIRSALAQL